MVKFWQRKYQGVRASGICVKTTVAHLKLRALVQEVSLKNTKAMKKPHRAATMGFWFFFKLAYASSRSEQVLDAQTEGRSFGFCCRILRLNLGSEQACVQVCAL